MDEKIAPLVKKGGVIALIVPGLKKDIHNDIPEEMLLSWTAEDIETPLRCDSEYAIKDRAAMHAGAGRYMNFVSVTARKK